MSPRASTWLRSFAAIPASLKLMLAVAALFVVSSSLVVAKPLKLYSACGAVASMKAQTPAPDLGADDVDQHPAKSKQQQRTSACFEPGVLPQAAQFGLRAPVLAAVQLEPPPVRPASTAPGIELPPPRAIA